MKNKFILKIILILIVILCIMWGIIVATDINKVKNGEYPIFCRTYILDTNSGSKRLTAHGIGYKIECVIDYWKIISVLKVCNIDILTIQYNIEH